MPDDWKEKLNKHYGGNRSNSDWKRQDNRGSQNMSQGHTTGLPGGYLANGYFDGDGSLYGELLTDIASKVAKSFGAKMSNSQLRRFYGHLKTAEKAYMYSSDEKRYINDVKALDPFVAEALGKEKVPQVFYDFIHINVELAVSVKAIQKGLLPHFQAVVAYFTYHYPKSK